MRQFAVICLVLGVVSAGLFAVGDDAAGRPAAKGSAEITGIVIPARATPAEHRAAAELSDYIARITGRDRLAIVSEERPGPAGRTLVVGRTRANLRAHKVDAWPRDTIHVGYGRGDIAVLGQGPQGTLLAAYQFLRDQGCRWYIPDHLDGRHIPRRARLALPDEPRQHTPSFKERGWYPAPTRPGAWDANYDWGVRNGVNALISVASVNYSAARGHGLGLRGGHTIWVLIPSADHPDAARTFAEHPEWYPLVGGRRVYQYVNGMPVQACVSNRQVVQDVARQVIEYFRQHPECWRFSVSPFDEPTYWCECDACRAMDDPASTWRVNDRTDAICLQSKAGPGPMTDRFVKFVNRVARIVARECPGKYVSFYAYGSTVAPPRAKDWKLEPNVVVEFAHYYGSTLCLKHAADDPQCPHNAPMHKWLTEWTSRPNPVLFYTYPPNGGQWDVPSGFTRRYKSLVAYTKRLGVVGWTGEDQGTWSGSALMLYLKGRLLWDADADVDDLMAEFCRDMYGPAAEPMLAYYRAFERELQDMPGCAVYGNWVGALPDAAVGKLAGLLTEAEKRADTPRRRRQVAMARVAMNGLQLVRMGKALGKKSDDALSGRYDKLRAATAALVKKHSIPVTTRLRARLSG